jgi:type 1 glutamine amidotransferase
MLKRFAFILALSALTTAQAVEHRFISNGFGKQTVSIIAADGSIERQVNNLKCVQDSWLLDNGNLVASWLRGVKEFGPDNQVVWEYKAPEGVELHSAQPLENGNVLACECGTKRLIEINRDGEIVKEIPLQTEAHTHAQFRTARKTKQGTYWVAFLKEAKVQEMDGKGKVLREFASPGGAHGLAPLPNNGVLVSGGYGGEVKEYDEDGKVVWHLSKADMTAAGVEQLGYAGGVVRLPNGNTVVALFNGIPQFFEVTPDKEMVWSYNNPELGKTASITILPSAPARKALIFSGGYEPHKPHEAAASMKPWLEEEGFAVTTADSMSCLDDAETLSTYDLIIPNWTMGNMTDAQIRNLSDAAKAGAGIAGLHGGAGDAFRGVKEYEEMIGGHFKKHPHVGPYKVNSVASLHPAMKDLPPSFDYHSEQYFMTMDSDVTVLMDSDYSSEEPGLRMPIAWVKEWGKGRVFYTSLGHNVQREYAQFTEAKQLFINGCLWAARKL